MAESTVQLVRRGFDAALRGDLEAIGALLDPDVSWHGGDPSAPGACHNRRQALAFMRGSDVIRGGRVELVEVVAAGEQVVVILRPPTDGPPPAPPVASVPTFRNAKVIELVHYANADDALAAA